ncbi:MAG: hypothetical protein L0Y80_02935 [Ignavibacteriae bacterium]|nr:hypothetical protein [Ignavibacteriota bacterium]
MASALANKLNLKAGMKVHVIGKPAGVPLSGVETTTSAKSDGVIVFVKTLAEVYKTCIPAIAAAKEDRIAWIVYPKAGQLDTDLNRDILWKHLLKRDIQGVRQIALDSVWSAMRFRPKK